MAKTKKQKLALEVIERLREEYPDAECTLDYDQAWKLLIGVRLAAQCTDERVNIVVEKLYEKFPDVDALAAGCGGDRRDRAPLWAWKKQGERHQRMYEDFKRAVWGTDSEDL